MMDLIARELPNLWERTGQHLLLTGAAILTALAVGVPLGIFCHRVRPLRAPVLWLVGILQTVPSVALLVLLLIATGKTGFLPAWIALTLYALLPIVRNTVTGLEGVPAGAVEAARGVGMTPGQRLTRVELPLALPVIVAGVRTAAVISVGIATLSAFIAAGGLGVFIFRGMSMSDPQYVLLGAVPAAILALLVDGAIWAGEWASRPIRTLSSSVDKLLRPIAVAAPAGLVILAVLTTTVDLHPAGAQTSAAAADTPERGTVIVGSKEFGEQLLLGEMVAQLLEAQTNLNVERKLGFNGTMMAHQAMLQGEIDLYVEYTGTGYLGVLKTTGKIPPPQEVFDSVDKRYREQFGLAWLRPLGFANTYALAVREEDAKQYGWTKVSDLAERASDMTARFTAEFQVRQDGYLGLIDTYGYRFRKAEDINPDIMYEALDHGEGDVIAAFSTDGRLEAYGLRVLEDDRHFWPPYDAAPVIRIETLQTHPEIAEALEMLSGKLDVPTMQRLNYEVSGKQRRIEDVSREFLQQQGLAP